MLNTQAESFGLQNLKKQIDYNARSPKTQGLEPSSIFTDSEGGKWKIYNSYPNQSLQNLSGAPNSNLQNLQDIRNSPRLNYGDSLMNLGAYTCGLAQPIDINDPDYYDVFFGKKTQAYPGQNLLVPGGKTKTVRVLGKGDIQVPALMNLACVPQVVDPNDPIFKNQSFGKYPVTFPGKDLSRYNSLLI